MAIVMSLKATDDDIIRIGNENPGYGVEREEDGTVTLSPTHTTTGLTCAEAVGQLWLYAKRAGGKAFDSSTGFAIGPGERLKCPDASWASPQTIASVPPQDQAGFWPISPDVAVEIKSRTDDFRDTVEKAKMYRERGSAYAVAINPDTRDVQPFGEPPDDLALDFDAMIDAEPR